jgi:carbonic anhydrase
MSFCTAITCIDGRAHLPVIEYLQRRFDVDYVDLVTAPGVVAVVSGAEADGAAESVYRRVGVSIEAHQSVGIAVVAHHDCAANQVSQEIQLSQLWNAVENISARFPGVGVVALWIGDSWKPQEVGPLVRPE